MLENNQNNGKQRPCQSVSRCSFVRGIAVATAASTMVGCGKNSSTFQALFQKHFQELTKEDLRKVLARLEKEYSEKYNQAVKVKATPALEGVSFGYALDLSRCIGCRRCVYACVKENNQSRDPQVQWIRVLEMEKDHGINLLHSTAYYNPSTVPQPGKFYFPVQCQQCENPSCVKVCPVKATWKDQDGIVVIDYNWCVGCRCCVSACPYGARHFNWKAPGIPEEEINPSTEYLGNRPRHRGVVEKCTFCVQRSREGRYPACVEVCPAGARKFGNLLDKESEISLVLENKRVFIFKEELNTQPKFFYFYGS